MGAELPAVTWLVPWLGLLILPPMGQGPVGTRLAVLFAELLLGLPAILGTPSALRSSVLPLRPGWRLLGIGLLMALPITLFHGVLTWVSQVLLPMPKEVEMVLRAGQSPQRPVEAVLVGLSLLMVAPVMEEIFFRGVLRHLWSRRSKRGIIWGPAVVFALAHGNPWSLPALVPLGLLLGWLRERHASLIPGILTHISVNAAGWWWLLKVQ